MLVGSIEAAGSRRQVHGGRFDRGGRRGCAGARWQARGSRVEVAGARWQVSGSRREVAGVREQAHGGRSSWAVARWPWRGRLGCGCAGARPRARGCQREAADMVEVSWQV